LDRRLNEDKSKQAVCFHLIEFRNESKMNPRSKKIIVSDIGGTYSRIAAFEVNSPQALDLIESIAFETDRFNSFDDLLDHLEESSFKNSLKGAKIIVIAVAGPVQSPDESELTNLDWPINLETAKNKYGKTTFFLINDFVAQAYGCLSTVGRSAKQIKTGKLNYEDTIAVVGAGTGLGHCSLRSESSRKYVHMPSEGGRVIFPFLGPEEIKFQQFVISEVGLPQVTGDDILSGRGLSLLHKYLTGKVLSPAEISREISPDSETARWFSLFYGRTCRNYVLTVLSLGGLFISGGLVGRNPYLVDCDTFKEEFTNSATKGNLLADIPIFLIEDSRIGLWGAAIYGILKFQEKIF
jgi:glucokinase